MAVDAKARAIYDASDKVIDVVRQLRSLASGVLDPVAGSVEPHPDTIADIKADAIVLYAEWDVAKAELDAAKTA